MDLNFSLNFKAADPVERNQLEQDMIYDLMVVGGGPAGLNAALYGKRKGLNVALITKSLGGQVKDTSSVENYLGTISASGEDLVIDFVKHLKELEVPILEGQMVVGYESVSDFHRLTLEYGAIYQSKTVLLALGSSPRKLGVIGEKELLGKGVAYCAICDGPLYKDKVVVIVGGGNSAVEAVLDLAKIASKVKLVHRSQLRADQILINELNKNENIEVYLETVVEAIQGENKVGHVLVSRKQESVNSVSEDGAVEQLTIAADGVFIEIGYEPNLGIFKEFISLNLKGEILIDSHNQTNVRGIFAAGDVTDLPYKQIVIAAAEGAKAALSINEYINKN